MKIVKAIRNKREDELSYIKTRRYIYLLLGNLKISGVSSLFKLNFSKKTFFGKVDCVTG